MTIVARYHSRSLASISSTDTAGNTKDTLEKFRRWCAVLVGKGGHRINIFIIYMHATISYTICHTPLHAMVLRYGSQKSKTPESDSHRT